MFSCKKPGEKRPAEYFPSTTVCASIRSTLVSCCKGKASSEDIAAMRKQILIFLVVMLAGIEVARCVVPEKAVPVLAAADEAGYNLMQLDLPTETETAGSALVAEMNEYILSSSPTAKSAVTGLLRGRSLILVCADGWTPDPADRAANPALYRLARESARIEQVWRPEWYLGMEGRLFALLSGLVPTRVGDKSSLVYGAEQSIYLPFSLPAGFSRSGYSCLALVEDAALQEPLAALGFGDVRTEADAARMTEAVLSALDGGETPLFALCVWPGDGENALETLLDALDTGRRDDVVLCLLTADGEREHAQLYLRGAELSGAVAAGPCSELDLPPTLLNLFGIAFDSRCLAGQDIFAPDTAPLVSLYGSAFSDWVTEAGRYTAAEDMFEPDVGTAGRSVGDDYVRAICRSNYERYIFSRRVMENNYFHLLFFGKE